MPNGAICPAARGEFISYRICVADISHLHRKYIALRSNISQKLEIALKECYETEYWLEILFRVNAMNAITYKTLVNKCGTIRRKLIASITTVKNKE